MTRAFLTAACAAAIILSSCGGGGGSGGGSGNGSGGGTPPPIPPSNNAPEIVDTIPPAVIENQTDYSYTETASDADGDTISFSLTGDDASLLHVNSGTGQVELQNVPDFENPEDANADNVYSYNVVVSDGKDQTSVSREIAVLNVFDTISLMTTLDQYGDLAVPSGQPIISMRGDYDNDGLADLLIDYRMSTGHYILVDQALIDRGDGQTGDNSAIVSGPGEEGSRWIMDGKDAPNVPPYYLPRDIGTDLDNDGHADLLITKYPENPNTGLEEPSALYLSGDSFPSQSGQTADLPTILASDGIEVTVDPVFREFGVTILSAGNLDGISGNEMLIANNADCMCSDEVDILIIPGERFKSGPGNISSETIPYTSAGIRLEAVIPDATQYSNAYASIGDISGDGKDELVIGAPQSFYVPADFEERGSIRIVDGDSLMAFSGTPKSYPADVDSTLIIGESLNLPRGTRNFGSLIRGVGDIDGDGLTDLYVGSSEHSYIIMAKTIEDNYGSTLDMDLLVAAGEVLTFENMYINEAFPVEDMDGDGKGEVIIGVGNFRAYLLFGQDLTAGTTTNWTEASLLSSGTAMQLIENNNGMNYLGAPGDADGDGLTDLVVAGTLTRIDDKQVDIAVISGAYVMELRNAGQSEIIIPGN